MAFSNPADSITLPVDATNGARIILDGTTNKITVYDSNNLPVIVISAQGDPSIVVGSDPTQAVINLLSHLGSAQMVFDPNGPTAVTPGQLIVQESTFGVGIPPNQLLLSLTGPTDDSSQTPRLTLEKIVGGLSLAVLDAGRVDITHGMTVAGATDISGGPVTVTRAVATNPSFNGKVTGDVNPRVQIRTDGAIILGDGTSGAGNADTRIFRSSSGQLAAHPINAVAAGNVAEPWTGFTFQNGWANSAVGEVQGKYRKVASPANSIQLVGELVPGTKADGTVITTLPVGYRPAAVTSFPIAANPVPAGTTTPLLQVKTNGDIQCFGLVAGTAVVYFTVIIPLDA